ncbi:MAG: hypothetical protein H6760_04290 [Candidatus Nomurabacteria bacterium]|nr:MAG: hypothetical protein H6760_04290 [Candidatus Nomurabacteria bacterium]
MRFPESCPLQMIENAELLHQLLWLFPWVGWVQPTDWHAFKSDRVNGLYLETKYPRMCVTLHVAGWAIDFEVYARDYGFMWQSYYEELQGSESIRAFAQTLKEERSPKMKHARGGPPRSKKGIVSVEVPEVPSLKQMEAESRAFAAWLERQAGVEKVTADPIAEISLKAVASPATFQQTKHGVRVVREGVGFVMTMQVKAARPSRPVDLQRQLQKSVREFVYTPGEEEMVPGGKREEHDGVPALTLADLCTRVGNLFQVREASTGNTLRDEKFTPEIASQLARRQGDTWVLRVYRDALVWSIELDIESGVKEDELCAQINDLLLSLQCAGLKDLEKEASGAATEPGLDPRRVDYDREVPGHPGLVGDRLRGLVAMALVPESERYGAIGIVKSAQQGGGTGPQQWLTQLHHYVRYDREDRSPNSSAPRFFLTEKAEAALRWLRDHQGDVQPDQGAPGGEVAPEIEGQISATELTGEYLECFLHLAKVRETEPYDGRGALNDHLGDPAGAHVFDCLVEHAWVAVDENDTISCGPHFELTEKGERFFEQQGEAPQEASSAPEKGDESGVVQPDVSPTAEVGEATDPVPPLGDDKDTPEVEEDDATSSTAAEVVPGNEVATSLKKVLEPTLPATTFSNAVEIVRIHAHILGNGTGPEKLREAIDAVAKVEALGLRVSNGDAALSLADMRELHAALGTLEESGVRVTVAEGRLLLSLPIEQSAS